MKVMKAFGPQDLRVVETPAPEPRPGWVLVKVRVSGICGSDKGIWFVKDKVEGVIGHEAAGEVVGLGEGVTSLAEGDRVMINNVGGCGECPACRAGAFALCRHREGAIDVNNGYGEYLIAPARNCLRIPDGLDYIDGALIMDNWGTPYGAIKRLGGVDNVLGVTSEDGGGKARGVCGDEARGEKTRSAETLEADNIISLVSSTSGIGAGTYALVSGCGPIGQAALALLKAFGAYVIAADPLEWRREFALRNGADAVFAPNELPEAARAFADGLGAHVAFECSGKGAAYDNCLKSLRNGGTLVTIGENAEFLLRPSDQLIRRSLGILGTWYSTLPNAAEVAQLALQSRVNLRSFLTHTISLDEVPSMFGRIVASEDGIMKCMIVFD